MDDNHRCGELFQAICPILVEYLKPKKEDARDAKQRKYQLRKTLRRVNKALRCLVDCTIETFQVYGRIKALPLPQSWRRWPNLQRLSTTSIPIADILPSLCHDGNCGDLTALELNFGSMTSEEATGFANLAALYPQLRYLRFVGDKCDTNRMLQIMTTTWPALEEFILCWVGYQQDSSSNAEAMGKMHVSCPSLKKLRLYNIGFSGSLMEALVSNCFPVLEELDLQRNSLRKLGELFGTKGQTAFPCLRVLCLRDCPFDDQMFKGLASATWPSLEKLDVGETREWTLQGGAALANASFRWPRLRSLDLDNCSITNEILKAILQGSWLSLQYLDLYCNPLTKEGYMALAAAVPRFPKLQELKIGDYIPDHIFVGEREQLNIMKSSFEWLRELLAAPWPSLSKVGPGVFESDFYWDKLERKKNKMLAENSTLRNGWKWHDGYYLLIRS
jgi:hypothetical protein